MRKIGYALLFTQCAVWAQEAGSGLEIRSTISSSTMYSHTLSSMPRNGGPVATGFRGMVYPTWKLNRNWTVSGVVQVHSRPYFGEEQTTQGYGVKTDLLQANISYSRVWNNKSVVLRAGQIMSAFGSFLLRYDDAENSLPDMPATYGYYYKSVTSYGMAGAQADVTLGKVDMRAQFVNSSPANRRSIFDRDQYGNWAGGAGYTIMQGLRVGGSAYYGPYLHREFAWYLPGEARPRDLPASAFGIDAQWARGHWNTTGELQWFKRPYRAMPDYLQDAGYAEIRRVLHPRWYVAVRPGYLRSNGSVDKFYDTAVGFRPNSHQLVKVGYKVVDGPKVRGTLGNTFTLQVVTSFRALSLARD